MTCGNGTQFRTRECDGDCSSESIEVQYKDCDMGCCPGNLMQPVSIEYACNTCQRVLSVI